MTTGIPSRRIQGRNKSQGNVLTTKPLVAKNEGVMQSTTPQTREFKIEGTTLWLIAKPAAGQTGAETRTKLTRLE